MTRAALADQLRSETTQNQGAASDPAASAWVGANAGTGKTHVLTERVLRLLLAGTKPERILALTYTKAAAAEMSKRVFDQLARWVTLPDEALAVVLGKLMRKPATPQALARARTLFAEAIETPGGLKVQTIHAFCERLLQRFPLEAGVPPGFSILDDAAAAELRRAASDDVLAHAASGDDAAMKAALHAVIAYAAEEGFDTLLAAALAKRDWLEIASRRDDIDAVYRRLLGVEANVTLDGVLADIGAALSRDEARAAVDALSGGSANDVKLAERLRKGFLGPVPDIDEIEAAFLTEKGEPRKRFVTKPTQQSHTGLLEKLLRAQECIAARVETKAILHVLDATLALARIGGAVMQRYADLKARRAALDFDDLVAGALRLVGSGRDPHTSSDTEWVLYKLDGGLDHILLDEAQDTSPEQWRLVTALVSEFYATIAEGQPPRTMFAVGDEKQSIYGFQGAAPEMFAAMGGELEALAQRADHAWRRVPLDVSFRTSEPVLDAVDAVFASPQRTPGLGSSIVRHRAVRIGHAGLVELWPVEAPEPGEETDPWSPLDERTTRPPVRRLARRIAATIAGWIERGDMLASQGRPIRPGDILILVNRRRPFAPLMVAELKQRGIPVAGADRLMLADQIAVQDLVALCEVIALPENDLALASVLKSPLFGLDDDALVALAAERRGSLWASLMEAGQAGSRFAEAAQTLRGWRGQADYVPPYELLSRILDADDGRFRRRMLSRLGAEAADAIDELVSLALAFDAVEPPSLQGFLTWLSAAPREIKRDMEQGRDEVRVMTVHGAKGLEAPIVILPDTCSSPGIVRGSGLLPLPDSEPVGGAPLQIWAVKGSSAAPAVDAARKSRADADRAERNRLLYVAMTRPRDRLYVAGWRGDRKLAEDCWYRLVEDGLASRFAEAIAEDGSTVRRIVSDQTAPPETKTGIGEATTIAVAPPEWARSRVPTPPRLVIPIAPSRLAPPDTDDFGDPVTATAGTDGTPRQPDPRPFAMGRPAMRRGILTHALLQHLPAVAEPKRRDVGIAFLKARAPDLPVALARTILEETLAVLDHPGLTAVFAADSRAEVPVVVELKRPDGRGPPIRLNGQIDRLAVRDGRVMFVDYKTNRPPPRDVADVPEAYLLQLAAYRIALAGVYASRPIDAALLWTDGAIFMPVPAVVLDAAEARLWQLGGVSAAR